MGVKLSKGTSTVARTSPIDSDSDSLSKGLKDHKKNRSNGSHRVNPATLQLPAGLLKAKNISKFNETYALDDEDLRNGSLGAGAFCVVKRATNKRNGETVAVKCITSVDILRNMRSVEMIQTEIKLLQALNHNNICKFIEVYTQRKGSEHPPECRIVLEHLDGGSLHRLVRARGHLSQNECLYLLQQALAAISHCHSKNVVHRDCKLENLLLTFKNADGITSEFPTLKLIDFGFAIISEEDNLTESCGTPEYIAPEIVRRIPYGKCVDLWALGVVAFTMSAGRFPFRGADLAALLKSIRKGEFTWNEKSNMNFSEDFKTFVQGLLEVNMSKRYTAESATIQMTRIIQQLTPEDDCSSSGGDSRSFPSFKMSELSFTLQECSNSLDLSRKTSAKSI